MISDLINKGHLPSDSEIIAHNNNVVVGSILEQTVTRIGRLSVIADSGYHGNIYYSHHLAWLLRNNGSVLAPVTEQPIIDGDYILSTFPMLMPADWRNVSGHDLYRVVADFNDGYIHIKGLLNLRELDIANAATERIMHIHRTGQPYDEQSLTNIQAALDDHQHRYPFRELREASPALLHCDLHSGNILTDKNNALRIIDLDSVAKGPRLYDVASWMVRHQRDGGDAPIDIMIETAQYSKTWDEEAYRALMGWKILSSMTYNLLQEEPQSASIKNNKLAKVACSLGVLNLNRT